MAQAPPLSAKEMAIALGTDARTLRKFLRDTTPIEEQPGQGGRWEFTRGDVGRLTKRFANWSTSKNGKGKKSEKVEEVTDIEEELEEVGDDDELDSIEEPDDDELEELEEEEDEEEDIEEI